MKELQIDVRETGGLVCLQPVGRGARPTQCRAPHAHTATPGDAYKHKIRVRNPPASEWAALLPLDPHPAKPSRARPARLLFGGSPGAVATNRPTLRTALPRAITRTPTSCADCSGGCDCISCHPCSGCDPGPTRPTPGATEQLLDLSPTTCATAEQPSAV
jgi:hypothetical protein